MKIHTRLALLVLAAACGSNDTRITPKDDPAAQVKVDNSAFRKKEKLSYTRANDYYATGAAQGALADETANRLSKAEAAELAKVPDPMGAMMLACYRSEFKEGFALAEQLFDTHQNLPPYWNQVATCHLLQGNERKALLFYNKAMEVAPGYVPALNNIGVIYSKTNQDQKALVALEKALAGGSFTKTPRYNLAFLLLSHGLAKPAQAHFQALLRDSPTDAELRAGHANSLVLLARWEEAWEEFNRVPDAQRRKPSVGLNMALTAHRLGKTDAAKAILAQTETARGSEAYASDVRRLLGE